MKKVLLIVAVVAGLISCDKDEKGTFVLTGTVQGVDGKNIILEMQDDSLGVIPVDTAKIENGKFRFTGSAYEPSMHSLAIESVPNKSYLIIESGEIKIEIDKDSIFLNKVSGTYNNDQLTEFSDQGLKFHKRMQNFQKENQNSMVAAQNSNDTVTMNRLRADFQKLRDELESNNEDYIRKHPKAFISLLLVSNMFRDFAPNVEKIDELFTGLDPEVKKTKVGMKLAKTIKDYKKVNVGKPAPDFSAPDPDGKTVKMSESLGKVTIIDFWASWCAPCRIANPELVALYKEFNPRGLNIIGVSLDKSGESSKWKEAIAKDNLTWTQVSNLKFWDEPIAAQYGVKSIPQMFLLDDQGVIVAKDLKGAELRNKVAELLGSAKQAQ